MMQKKWFKIFIWFISSSFFFAASSILIATYSPAPTDQQVMSYMSGMMNAMHNSLMGLSMTLESDAKMKAIVFFTSYSSLVLILGGIVAGDYVRRARRKKNG